VNPYRPWRIALFTGTVAVMAALAAVIVALIVAVLVG
jgi:hypothetical protein